MTRESKLKQIRITVDFEYHEEEADEKIDFSAYPTDLPRESYPRKVGDPHPMKGRTFARKTCLLCNKSVSVNAYGRHMRRVHNVKSQ